MLDCLALALEQSAAYVRHRRCTLAAYIADWESKRQTVLAWHDADKIHYPRSIAITYQTSVAQLSEDARQLFRILSWIAPDPIPLTAIDHLKALPNPRVLLIELADLHLARLSPNGSSATVHRLLQEITRQQHADPKPEPLLTALDWVNEEMPDDTDDVRTWPIAAPLVPHAVATATFGADRDIPEPSAELLNNAALLMNSQANYLAAEPLYRRTLAIKERAECENERLFATYLGNFAQLPVWLAPKQASSMASPWRMNGSASTKRLVACRHRALELDEASYGSEHPEVGTDLGKLAELLQLTNRLAEAECPLRRQLQIFLKFTRETGHSHPDLMDATNNYAALLRKMGDTTERAEEKISALKAKYGVTE